MTSLLLDVGVASTPRIFFTGRRDTCCISIPLDTLFVFDFTFESLTFSQDTHV